MPAPAVIPARIAYVKVVAVKTLVVDIRSSELPIAAWCVSCLSLWRPPRGFGVGASIKCDLVHLLLGSPDCS